MADTTKIQWCDSTVNPIMGCRGCELFPPPMKILKNVAEAIGLVSKPIELEKLKSIYQGLIDSVFANTKHEALPSHSKELTSTNIWHLRDRFVDSISCEFGSIESIAAKETIKKSITCYAAKVHLMRGTDIRDLEKEKLKKGHVGYSKNFELITQYEGRMEKTAKLTDLLGKSNDDTPWKAGLPRMIFVSDMGDAFSNKQDFGFLKETTLPAITSKEGKKHLWLWLTKATTNMKKFSKDIDGFPPNVCVMTTLTGADNISMQRLRELKEVKASIKGLSIEPLWERIPPEQLDLEGIDWLILGGESGSGNLTRKFDLAWVEELRQHCELHRVAFFLKQLGKIPVKDGEVIPLKDSHGGDWAEWDESLKVRDFPRAFHEYRKAEETPQVELRPVVKKQKKKIDSAVSKEEKEEFKKLDRIVQKGVKAFWEMGEALMIIKERKLWRAKGHKSWESYCGLVLGMSKPHAHRMIKAAGIFHMLKSSPQTLPIGNVLPKAESQVRPLLKLEDVEMQAKAWKLAVEQSNKSQPSAIEVEAAVSEVLPKGEKVEVKESRAQVRIKHYERLKELVKQRDSWDELDKILQDLEAYV